MAEQTSKPAGEARQRRVKLAGEIIDRIDIARHLVLAEAVSSRLALALRILQQTADDIAELAGIEDDDRERAAIRRAASARPVKAERRASVGNLLALGAAGAFALGALGFAVVSHTSRWWAVAVVALPAVALAQDRREYATAAEFVAAAEAHCVRQGQEVEPCMAVKRMQAAAGLDVMAAVMPRVVAACEAEHSDPLAVVWCGRRTAAALRRD